MASEHVRPPAVLVAALANGFAAGLAGTAAMTVSSTVEMKLRGRPASTVPARAAAKVLGVEPKDERRFATLVHWVYGTAWGAARGVIGTLGCRGPEAAALHFATVWGAELAVLPELDVGVPPAWRWGATEIAVDAFHHAVYATVTSAVYEWMDSPH
jgi:hypothetical protein